MELARQASGIGALADPIRRALYAYVVEQDAPVGREQAAAALDLAPHVARSQLDRLVEEGLLTTEFRRLSGKSGPGAGRPNKLYRRADQEFSVSLPERRYDLVGHLLAGAVERVREEGELLDRALEHAADAAGHRVAAAATSAARPSGSGLARLAAVLKTQGFEPRLKRSEVVLTNCPFDALAREHTELVCGLNRSFVQGVADGLGVRARACLEPEPGCCCVRIRRERAEGAPRRAGLKRG